MATHCHPVLRIAVPIWTGLATSKPSFAATPANVPDDMQCPLAVEIYLPNIQTITFRVPSGLCGYAGGTEANQQWYDSTKAHRRTASSLTAIIHLRNQ